VDITLTGASLAEGLPASTPVGTLAAMDYSPSDTFTYALVAGPGSSDNSKFKTPISKRRSRPAWARCKLPPPEANTSSRSSARLRPSTS
jgi:hypothetical protein